MKTMSRKVINLSKMISPIKRFEATVLKPMQILILIVAVALLLRRLWWGVPACILSLFYLGVVGFKLHPLQTAPELSQGPVAGPAAIREAEFLPIHLQVSLVSQACTRIGMLIGTGLALVLLAVFGWHWYWALAVFWLATLAVAAALKLAFRAI